MPDEPSVTADEPAVARALAQIARLGGPALQREIATLFVAGTESALARARAALAATDPASLAAAAHLLKSSCGQLGAITLQGHCEELEGRARGGDLDGAEALLDEITRGVHRLRARLEQAGSATPAAPPVPPPVA